MKKIFKFLLILVLLGAVAVGLLIWNINPVLALFKPKIENIISGGLHQPVAIGEMSLKFFPEFAVNVADVRLAGGDIPVVKDLILKAQLAPLLHRELNVSEVGIDGAALNVIRDESGKITLNGLPIGSEDKKPSAENKDAADDKSASISLDVKSAWLKNSRVTWTDKKITPAQTVVIDDIAANIDGMTAQSAEKINLSASLLGKSKNNFRLSGSMHAPNAEMALSLDALDFDQLTKLADAYGGGSKDLMLSGESSFKATVKGSLFGGGGLTVSFDATKAGIVFKDIFEKLASVPLTIQTSGQADISGKVTLPSVDIKLADIELSAPIEYSPLGTTVNLKTVKFPLATLEKLFPAAKSYHMSGELSGAVTTVVRADAPPLTTGSVQIKNAGVEVSTKDKPLTLSGMNLNLEMKDSKYILKPSVVPIFGGKVALQAEVNEAMNLNGSAKAQKLDLAQIADFTGASAKVGMTGNLDTATLQINGPVANLAAQASGTLNAIALNGTLQGFNLLGQTVGKLATVPLIGDSIKAVIPEKYRPLIDANSTAYEKLTINSSFSGKNITLSEINLQHSVYLVTGSGEIRANGDMDVRAQLRLTPAVTEGMVSRSAKLKLLLDPRNNLVVPLMLHKKNGVFIVLPDVSELGKTALGSVAKDTATKALDKVAPGLGGALDSLFK